TDGVAPSTGLAGSGGALLSSTTQLRPSSPQPANADSSIAVATINSKAMPPAGSTRGAALINSPTPCNRARTVLTLMPRLVSAGDGVNSNRQIFLSSFAANETPVASRGGSVSALAAWAAAGL